MRTALPILSDLSSASLDLFDDLAALEGIHFGFETSGRRVTTVKTTRGDISVEEIILVGGSWSATMARELRIKGIDGACKGLQR